MESWSHLPRYKLSAWAMEKPQMRAVENFLVHQPMEKAAASLEGEWKMDHQSPKGGLLFLRQTASGDGGNGDMPVCKY